MPDSGSRSGTTRHRLVKEYLNGQRKEELNWNSVDPSGRACAALKALNEAVQHKLCLGEAVRNDKTVLELFRAIPATTLLDAELALIFLDSHAMAAYRAANFEEMQAVIRKAESLVEPDTAPQLRADLCMTKGLLAHGQGNIAGCLDLHAQAESILPVGSPGRRAVSLQILGLLAINGRCAEAEQTLQAVTVDATPVEQIRLAAFKFIDAVETHRLEDAARELAFLKRHPTDFKALRNGYASHFVVYEYLSGGRSLAKSEEGIAQREREPVARILVEFDHLLNRRPLQALDSARRFLASYPELAWQRSGRHLLRAELACGHHEAALRILNLSRAAGNVRYLDDFHFARIALLADDRESAARHFAAVTEACRRYRALGRLRFETDLACELSPADAAWLERAAAKAGPAVPADTGRKNAATRPVPTGVDRLIGTSSGLARIRSTVMLLAAQDAPVLITGETGTGKELVARAIHDSGPRAAGPFLAINCGAIAESLLESEIFGHERGAFTGAGRARRSVFEEAADGTVFLDEIGEISPHLQVALLRVLETGEIRPVGSNRIRHFRCRILAATNADLQRLVDAGSFRSDLYYRLKRLDIHLPPLREHPEDLVPLAEHFLSENRSDGRRPQLAPPLREWLLRQPWPGNVRELRNFTERLRLLNSEKLEYDLIDVPPGSQAAAGADDASQPPLASPSEAPVTANLPESVAPGPPAARNSPVVPAEQDEAAFLAQGRGPLRRHKRLRALFARHGELTRQELVALLRVSPDTVSRDLRRLCAEGFIERVAPTGSTRTHYFRLRPS